MTSWLAAIGFAWATGPPDAPRSPQPPAVASEVRAGLPPRTPESVVPLALDAAARAVLPPPHGTGDERMADVLARVDRLGLRYADTPTGTASEVAAGGTYNCLSLAHLLVALGRAQGVDVGYVRVRSYRTWRGGGGAPVLVSSHVAAGWGPPGDLRVVDPTAASDRERQVAERISDAEALGLHRANVGVEHLLAGDPERALRWFDAASAVAPGLPEALVDRGVALRRLGDPAGAAAAWQEALRVDPERSTAQVNLAALAVREGDLEGARALLRAATASARDPHALLALGALGIRAGDPAGAEAALRRAARLDPTSAEPRDALAELAESRGDARASARWRARADRRRG